MQVSSLPSVPKATHPVLLMNPDRAVARSRGSISKTSAGSAGSSPSCSAPGDDLLVLAEDGDRSRCRRDRDGRWGRVAGVGGVGRQQARRAARGGARRHQEPFRAWTWVWIATTSWVRSTRTSTRSNAGSTSRRSTDGLREQRVDGALRQDRPVARVSRCEGADRAVDVARPAGARCGAPRPALHRARTGNSRTAPTCCWSPTIRTGSTRATARGTRERLDAGVFGVVSLRVSERRRCAEDGDFGRGRSDPAVPRDGWNGARERFQVDSGAPVEVGVDGEALMLDPPLVFETHPGALRVRTPRHAPGVSPAAKATSPWALDQLAEAALGRSGA